MNVEMKAEVVIKWKTATGVAVIAPSTKPSVNEMSISPIPKQSVFPH